MGGGGATAGSVIAGLPVAGASSMKRHLLCLGTVMPSGVLAAAILNLVVLKR